MINNKERWIYVRGYKPPDVKLTVFISAFILACDHILKRSSNVIALCDYDCNSMSDNALQDLSVSFDMHKLVSAPTGH